MKKTTEIKFTIPVAPKTKKNHGQIITIKGRPIMLPSKQYREYEKECLKVMKDKFGSIPYIDYAVNLKATYYTKTRHRVDLINLHSALHDMLVKAEVLEDDNSKIIVSTDGSRVYYDKENPRTEVVITEVQDDTKS